MYVYPQAYKYTYVKNIQNFCDNTILSKDISLIDTVSFYKVHILDSVRIVPEIWDLER